MPRANKTNLRLVVYNGVEYVAYGDDNYYMNRRSQRSPRLHQQIYMDSYGPIPKGYHVHHKDGNPENNDISNLVAIPHGEHTKETMAQRWEHPVVRVCKSCGARFETISTRSEYCSKTCCHREWSRKNREWLHKYNKRRLLNA